jgi:nitrogen-specific signal transduction histidine kinase
MELNTTWAKDTEHLLPKITSLILEGVHSERKDRDTDFKLFRDSNLFNRNPFVHHLQVPSPYPSKKDISIAIMPKATFGLRSVCVTYHHAQMQFVRSFIRGLSNNYNNLLMGIWGNTSLMKMILEKGHPAQSTLNQIESLIQNGSNLVHLIFGYVIERRADAKKLRLKQLVQEIQEYNDISGNDINLNLIETSISEIPRIENKTKLAACLSRIVNQMLTMVHSKCQFIKKDIPLDLSKAEDHLKKIDAILERGFQMIRNLDYYAESIAPKKEKVDLKSIVRQQVGMAAVKSPDKEFTMTLSASIPEIRIDAEQIGYALKQLMDNAIDAVAENGSIHTQVDTLDSEKPQDRFGLHMLSNYAVITVKDTGRGMITETQSKIFDPYFTTYEGQARTGLGLAAAAGIIKCHGGYIQVRSKQGNGSSIRIYLPRH